MLFLNLFIRSSEIQYYFHSASFLNYDLFRVGIVSDSSCRCGAALDNFKHFKKIHYRITGITGTELSEHEHHMNPS
jgi:hypothetical protein